MVTPIEGTDAVRVIRTSGTAEQEFKAALSKAVADPDPTPKPSEPPSDRRGAEPDVQPMDPSRPDLWIGGSGGNAGHNDDFVVPPPDDWEPNPGDVWKPANPNITYV
jgi:hypothetical protein